MHTKRSSTQNFWRPVTIYLSDAVYVSSSLEDNNTWRIEFSLYVNLPTSLPYDPIFCSHCLSENVWICCRCKRSSVTLSVSNLQLPLPLTGFAAYADSFDGVCDYDDSGCVGGDVDNQGCTNQLVPDHPSY